MILNSRRFLSLLVSALVLMAVAQPASARPTTRIVGSGSIFAPPSQVNFALAASGRSGVVSLRKPLDDSRLVGVVQCVDVRATEVVLSGKVARATGFFAPADTFLVFASDGTATGQPDTFTPFTLPAGEGGNASGATLCHDATHQGGFEVTQGDIAIR